jgi:uncharacterized protein (TIGR00255 family)
MTGYARAAAESPRFVAEVEMRSVNHRFLDLHLRLPSTLSRSEPELRQMFTARLGRGKVDVTVRLRPRGESGYELEVDRSLVGEIVTSSRALGSELGVRGEVSLADLIGLPQVFGLKERDFSANEESRETVSRAVAEALSDLCRMKESEGRALADDMKGRLLTIGRALDSIEELAVASRSRRREDLQQKIEELLAAASLEPQAVAMEVARLVDRSDVAEEVTRFRSHLRLWEEAAAGNEPCGKKLDFIVQELNREINTIGSKSQDAAVTAQVIAIKSELERVREQVQNIE